MTSPAANLTLHEFAPTNEIEDVLSRRQGLQPAYNLIEGKYACADPFLLEGWTLGARLLLEQGRKLAARAFIRERLVMLDALAPPEERLAMSAALSDLDEVRAALSQMLQREPVLA